MFCWCWSLILSVGSCLGYFAFQYLFRVWIPGHKFLDAFNLLIEFNIDATYSFRSMQSSFYRSCFYGTWYLAMTKCGFSRMCRSSHPEVFLINGILKICSKFTGKHPCEVWFQLLCHFIEIALRHGHSPVNLLHIFRIPFPKNISGWLRLVCVSL